MQQLQAQIMALPADEWQELLGWMVSTEKHRRNALPAVERGQADLVAELQEAGKLDKPDAVDAAQATEKPDSIPAWVNPLTDHARMYHAGAVVTHNNKVWESTHPGLNHWEPRRARRRQSYLVGHYVPCPPTRRTRRAHRRWGDPVRAGITR
ncbi:hypothetical protein QP968_00785 [Corynebacterium sp. MSK041]|uniref:hypothetical protein n=1 Tax=Corynebacterium sp. MSK041 TaxID=3050194 RepID=UPI00254BB791|nr:hypothetical protein [Corynebacterium sp. MSK041]MDK8794249.1 hypothetical protein [Corynebacterium sp. MSK041]